MKKEIAEKIPAEKPRTWAGNPALYLFVILAAGIGLRLYKAHYTGIVYDEVWTVEDYCKDLHTAITSYKSTNNHILNSIFIILSGKVFGGYEHYPRIPAVLFGVLFCCAIMDIVHRTFRRSVLKIVVFLLIILNWFIFDITYLARGYAIAMGATYGCVAVLSRLSLGSSEQAGEKWRLVFLLIVVNFLAMGSMLSSLNMVLSVNAAYMFLTIIPSVKQGKKALFRAVGRILAVVFVSAASLYLLYRRVLPDVVSLGKEFNSESFLVHLRKVLLETQLYIDFSRLQFNKLILNATLVLLAVCALICAGAFLFGLKTKKTGNSFLQRPSALILTLTGGVLFLMFIQNAVFGISLGMPRNSVFLLPLVMLSSGIIIERAICVFSGVKFLQLLFHGICVALLLMLCFLNLPSLQAVDIRPLDWGEQSVIGPLARMLREIDPAKTWNVRLVIPHTESCYRPMQYYQRFGYHLNWVKEGPYDV